MKPSFIHTRSSQLAIAVACSTLLMTACGGEGDTRVIPSDNNPSIVEKKPTASNPTNTATQKQRGRFIDSAVGNVAVYQNGKQVATTDSEGYFDYIEGSKVTFKVGKLTLGSTMPKEIVTPADLARDKKDVVEILQALQSLDEDNNPDNGIYISQVTLDKLVTAGNLSDKKVSLADTVQKDIPNVKIVDDKKAVDHFAKAQQTLKDVDELAQFTDKLVGYWQSDCQSGDQMVQGLIKSPTEKNVLLATDIVTREYENKDCTGTYKDRHNTIKAGEMQVQVTRSYKEGNKIHFTILTKVIDDGKTHNDVSNIVRANAYFL